MFLKSIGFVVCATIAAGGLAHLQMQAELPDPVAFLISLVVTPFLWIGGAVTYFCVAGDNYSGEKHFWPYVVPASVLANAVLAVVLLPVVTQLWKSLVLMKKQRNAKLHKGE
ncbi:hypothetical protein [Rosistilla oblonga]|uniref:Uncharacterized protein n=1 Tax=Rosistilla oblonga TaxID=2527990 RepID=A0A518J043_9BACT|nr:hypothetical protein [Rosistilla oblonga]QDV58700.1 hypothetical protein Mal33_47240 [Rosistilla oblonga]